MPEAIRQPMPNLFFLYKEKKEDIGKGGGDYFSREAKTRGWYQL